MKTALRALAALVFVTVTAPAMAGVIITISLASQTMRVDANGTLYVWQVSTAKPGYRTPGGAYTPYWLDANHHSSKYNWAPMPHSIFFKGGYAIHGTTELAELGTPASHGCVRLHPDNAAILFNLVRQAGLVNTEVIVQ